MARETQFSEIVFAILGYREDGEWVALALDMDLRGYGPTFDDALAELVELVEMQISFAIQKGHPEMIWKRAEEKWFGRWDEARRAMFTRSLAPEGVFEDEYRAGSIPPPHIIAGLSEFSRANA